jgi:hypothetical protein
MNDLPSGFKIRIHPRQQSHINAYLGNKIVQSCIVSRSVTVDDNDNRTPSDFFKLGHILDNSHQLMHILEPFDVVSTTKDAGLLNH